VKLTKRISGKDLKEIDNKTEQRMCWQNFLKTTPWTSISHFNESADRVIK